jgi:hypothetical protein
MKLVSVSLDRHPLAVCNDGQGAAYYFQVRTTPPREFGLRGAARAHASRAARRGGGARGCQPGWSFSRGAAGAGMRPRARPAGRSRPASCLPPPRRRARPPGCSRRTQPARRSRSPTRWGALPASARRRPASSRQRAGGSSSSRTRPPGRQRRSSASGRVPPAHNDGVVCVQWRRWRAQVYLKYCSSDAHVGDRAASPETHGWHFRGESAPPARGTALDASLSLSPSLPLSISPSLPLSLSPSLPFSLSPSPLLNHITSAPSPSRRGADRSGDARAALGAPRPRCRRHPLPCRVAAAPSRPRDSLASHLPKAAAAHASSYCRQQVAAHARADVSRCSAGGRGAMFTLDYAEEMLPLGVKVLGILDAPMSVAPTPAC